MTLKKFLVFLTVLTMIAAVSCKKEKAPEKIFKTVSADTNLIENPGEQKPINVTNGKLKRGEYLILEEEKYFDEKRFFRVTIEGTKTIGWINSVNVKDGKLDSETVIQDDTLYIRPNVKSDKAGSVKAGQVVFKLEDSGEFVLIQFPGKEAYILKSSLGNADDVIKTVSISGVGKAEITSSSQFIPSEGKETVFDPRNVFDGNDKTAWGEGKTGGDGIGESITITLENTISIASISIINGYTYTDETYNDNHRVASLKITSDTGMSVILNFDDNIKNFQTRDCEPNIYGRSFTFMINSIYKGKYNRTYISEIKIKPGSSVNYDYEEPQGDD